LEHVLLAREYSGLDTTKDVRLIIDCGANIGASAFYFLHAHPGASLIAVEPDPANAEMCRKNLAPFFDRATVVQAAVWKEECRVNVVKGLYRDGRDWSIQVHPALSGESGSVPAVTIGQLLESSCRETIDILKIDIEAAEGRLFESNFEDWLSRTRNIAIELHDATCEAIFWAALANYKGFYQKCSDLTICKELVRIIPREIDNTVQ
jgi:FkbM family methyltransferase